MKNTKKAKVNTKNPMYTALQFNEFINSRNISHLSRLMSDDHLFADRDGNVHRSKKTMIKIWEEFFEMFPAYKNNFTRIELRDDLVIIFGHAYWTDYNSEDSAIWTVRIEGDLVAEWKIYYDTAENRNKLQIY